MWYVMYNRREKSRRKKERKNVEPAVYITQFSNLPTPSETELTESKHATFCATLHTRSLFYFLSYNLSYILSRADDVSSNSVGFAEIKKEREGDNGKKERAIACFAHFSVLRRRHFVMLVLVIRC